jgi:hypothetical protein
LVAKAVFGKNTDGGETSLTHAKGKPMDEFEKVVREDFTDIFGGPPNSNRQIVSYMHRALSNGVDEAGQRWLLRFLKDWMKSAEKLREDFREWSGGFPPESDHQITVYIDYASDITVAPEEARKMLRGWMAEVDPGHNLAVQKTKR